MQRNLCVTEYTCSYSVLWSNWCASSTIRLTNRESSYCCPQRVQKVLRGRFRWWKYLKDALQERVFKIYNHATPPKSQTSSFLAEQLHYFLTGLVLLLCSPPVHFHLAATVIFTECWSSLTHGLLQMPPASVHRLSEPSPWPLKSSIMQPWVCPSSSGSPLLLFTLQAPQTHVCHSFLTLILLLKTVLPFLLTIPHHLQIPSHIRALSWFPGQVSLLSYPHTQRRELQSKRHHWD